MNEFINPYWPIFLCLSSDFPEILLAKKDGKESVDVSALDRYLTLFYG